MRRLRLGLGQINSTVGDFNGNLKKILAVIDEARALGVNLIVFPELAICGYPPEDLLLKLHFVQENRRYLQKVVGASQGLTVITGFVDSQEDIYNAAAVIYDGKLIDIYHKRYLPNYGVFDENRYFQEGHELAVYLIGGIGVGVNVCEDIWYESGPATTQAYCGAEIIVNISSSPYHYGKDASRERMLGARAADVQAVVAYCNMVGGQDELVFDGQSMIFDEKGDLIAKGKPFEEDLVVTDLDIDSVTRARLRDPRWRKGALSVRESQCCQKKIISEAPAKSGFPPLPPRSVPRVDLLEEVYKALVLGTHDYIVKNGFRKVVIGLSGGIDSSLTATIAVDAMGAENVIGVSMPSRFSSEGSVADASWLAKNLGIKLLSIPIGPAFDQYLQMLKDVFQGTEFNIAEENVQARIRGNILMALSNKFNWLVLATGNKSELATGYCTIYGDMAGGFSVLKDVLKTTVYQLAEYKNSLAGFDSIPLSVLQKAPSAELRPDQKDTDSLPPFDILDPIITAYMEEDKSSEQIITMGFDQTVVKRAVQMMNASEYKRRQAAPGVKITTKAFGRDRRLPITNRFKG